MSETQIDTPPVSATLERAGAVPGDGTASLALDRRKADDGGAGRLSPQPSMPTIITRAMN